MTAVRTITFAADSLPPVNEREVWRYAGYCGKPSESELLSLLREAEAEAAKVLAYRVCYTETELKGSLPLGIVSKDLSRLLSGCDAAVVFALTVGIELDRRIAKYSRLSPSRALLMQAIGAERVEALANVFCGGYDAGGRAKTARFSPGYGDLPLAVQEKITRLLDCEKHIGLTLNGSLMLSPSKSITAIFGLERI